MVKASRFTSCTSSCDVVRRCWLAADCGPYRGDCLEAALSPLGTGRFNEPDAIASSLLANAKAGKRVVMMLLSRANRSAVMRDLSFNHSETSAGRKPTAAPMVMYVWPRFFSSCSALVHPRTDVKSSSRSLNARWTSSS